MESFTSFPNLPAELRLKIWKAALPGPRTVRINLSLTKPLIPPSSYGRKPPTLLSVCVEARGVGLGFYRSCFTSPKSKPSPGFSDSGLQGEGEGEGRGVYIDPLLDTVLLLPPCPASCYELPNCWECVHFDFVSHLSRYDPGPVEEVRNVAIYGFGLEGLGSLWRFFGGLRRLSVVLDEAESVFVQREEPLRFMVEGLLQKAGEELEALRGRRRVEVSVVRGLEVG